MNVSELNKLTHEKLFSELEKCCGSQTWIKGMISARPFADKESVHEIADKIWSKVAKEDILEAFTHHPQIGNIESLKKKFSNTATWAGNEQNGTTDATDETLQALKKGNEDYFNKFGFIFIVCATGKSAKKMLDLLNERLPNDEAIELHIAAKEQNKITHLRIDKLLEN